MKKMGKIFLFCSSYLLLFIILLIRKLNDYLNLDQNTPSAPVILQMILYSVLILVSIFSIIIFKRSYAYGSFEEKTRISIKSVSNGNHEIVSYLITFVFPLIGDFSSSISTNDWVDFSTMLIILIFVAILYTNSNLTVINPVLVMFGYSINKINYCYEKYPNIELEGILLTEGNFDFKLISSTSIVNKIDENIFIIRRFANGKRKN